MRAYEKSKSMKRLKFGCKQNALMATVRSNYKRENMDKEIT